MTLSYTSDLAQQALKTTTALLSVQNSDQKDAESARIYDALFSIREMLATLTKLLQYSYGAASLDPHTFLLERYNSFLFSNSTLLQGGLREDRGSPTRLFKALTACRQQTQQKAHLLRFLETLVTDLTHHTKLLENPYATVPECTMLPMRQRPQHHRSPFGNYSGSGRLSRQTDEEIQDRSVHLDEPIELEGDMARPVEVQCSPVSARRQLHTLSAAPILQSHTTNTSPGRDESQVVGPLTCPSTPPPPYDPDASPALDTANSMIANHIVMTSGEDTADYWQDPITSACRRIMAQRFPTTTSSLFDDYSTYRQQIRKSSNYRWFLNFRYLSFIFQPESPFEVFPVKLDVRQTRRDLPQIHHTNLSHALLYLFDDCLVFGRSPFVSELPDPRRDRGGDPDSIPLTIDSGVEIVDSIRFCRFERVAKEESKRLIIESSLSEDCKQISRLLFQRSCECSRIFSGLRRFFRANEVRQSMSDRDLPVRRCSCDCPAWVWRAQSTISPCSRSKVPGAFSCEISPSCYQPLCLVTTEKSEYVEVDL